MSLKISALLSCVIIGVITLLTLGRLGPKHWRKPSEIYALVLLVGGLFMCGLTASTSALAKAQQAYPAVYQAELIRVIDGDSIEAKIYAYPQITINAHIRLAGVDTPELNAKTACERAAAKAARSYVAHWFGGRKRFQVHNLKLGKYARRVVAQVSQNNIDLGKALIASGHGRHYAYGPAKPWCTPSSIEQNQEASRD